MSSISDTFDELFDAIYQRKLADSAEKPAPPQRPSVPSNPPRDFKPDDQTNHKLSGTQMTQPQDLIPILENCFNNVAIEENQKIALIRTIMLNVTEFNTTSHLQRRLDVLYQHEKNYLNLIKEFKEEIKFIGSMQEDLRKERARFFADTLREVTEALNEAKVSEEVARQWLQELVGTYTRSLDLTAGLIEEHSADALGQIREHAQGIVNRATTHARNDEPN